MHCRIKRLAESFGGSSWASFNAPDCKMMSVVATPAVIAQHCSAPEVWPPKSEEWCSVRGGGCLLLFGNHCVDLFGHARL